MTLAKAKRKGKRKRKSKKVSSVRMAVLNLHKKISYEQLWWALRWVVPGLRLKQHPNVDVTLTNSPGHHAVYYPMCEVVAHINGDERHYPCWHEKDGKAGYISQWYLDPMECLISFLTHEFRHGWQEEHEGSRRGKVWRARKNGSSERDADYYAIRKVREYRRCRERLEQYEQKVREAVEYLLPSLYKPILRPITSFYCS